jgi:hypothetical protein
MSAARSQDGSAQFENYFDRREVVLFEFWLRVILINITSCTQAERSQITAAFQGTSILARGNQNRVAGQRGTGLGAKINNIMDRKSALFTAVSTQRYIYSRPAEAIFLSLQHGIH